MDTSEQLRLRNAALREEVEALLQDYREQRARVAAVQAELSRLSARVTSGDRAVTVTVGPGGTLQALEISPYAFRQLDPAVLAAGIVETAQQAADEVARRQRELVGPLGGDRITDPATGLPDVTRLLPPDVESWWSR